MEAVRAVNALDDMKEGLRLEDEVREAGLRKDPETRDCDTRTAGVLTEEDSGRYRKIRELPSIGKGRIDPESPSNQDEAFERALKGALSYPT